MTMPPSVYVRREFARNANAAALKWVDARRGGSEDAVPAGRGWALPPSCAEAFFLQTDAPWSGPLYRMGPVRHPGPTGGAASGVPHATSRHEECAAKGVTIYPLARVNFARFHADIAASSYARLREHQDLVETE